MSGDLNISPWPPFCPGLADFARIEFFYNLDNHENFIDRHQEEQKRAWERVANLISLMKEVNLFPEEVTLVVATEFSRPPFLNENNGKDHNFFDNSLLIGGRGIQGGHRIGDHHLFVRNERRGISQLSGCHMDFRTGRIVKDGYDGVDTASDIPEDGDIRLIRPRNIWRTVAEVLGLNIHRLPGPIRQALPLPRLIRKT